MGHPHAHSKASGIGTLRYRSQAIKSLQNCTSAVDPSAAEVDLSLGFCLYLANSSVRHVWPLRKLFLSLILVLWLPCSQVNLYFDVLITPQ